MTVGELSTYMVNFGRPRQGLRGVYSVSVHGEASGDADTGATVTGE